MTDPIPLHPDEAIRRGYYAQLIEASTDELARMVYAMRTNKLPPLPREWAEAS